MGQHCCAPVQHSRDERSLRFPATKPRNTAQPPTWSNTDREVDPMGSAEHKSNIPTSLLLEPDSRIYVPERTLRKAMAFAQDKLMEAEDQNVQMQDNVAGQLLRYHSAAPTFMQQEKEMEHMIAWARELEREQRQLEQRIRDETTVAKAHSERAENEARRIWRIAQFDQNAKRTKAEQVGLEIEEEVKELLTTTDWAKEQQDAVLQETKARNAQHANKMAQLSVEVARLKERVELEQQNVVRCEGTLAERLQLVEDKEHELRHLEPRWREDRQKYREDKMQFSSTVKKLKMQAETGPSLIGNRFGHH